MKPRTYIHCTDAPFVLGDGAQLVGQHIIGGGALYGRFLFTGHTLVQIDGSGVLVRDCYFERI